MVRFAHTIYPYSLADIASGVVYAIIKHMSEMIVVDTSVLVSALIGAQGPSREILRRCLQGDLDALISNALFLEYEDVSRRERILDLCPLSSREIRELLNSFYNVCRWIPVYYLWRPNIVDEGDNFLIELAVAGNASYILTNNVEDLRNAELSFSNFSIVTPDELLRGN